MKKIALALASLALAITTFASEYPDITIKQLRKALEAKQVTVIDVNGSESYVKGHVPGAVDFEAVKDKFASVLPQDKNALVVAYCGGPKCMAYKSAAEAAEKLGYKNVKHMSAGISGWKESRMKLEKAK